MKVHQCLMGEAASASLYLTLSRKVRISMGLRVTSHPEGSWRVFSRGRWSGRTTVKHFLVNLFHLTPVTVLDRLSRTEPRRRFLPKLRRAAARSRLIIFDCHFH